MNASTFLRSALLLLLAVPSFSEGVLTLNDSNFEHETQASTGMTTGSWFVLFKAEQCGHCKKVWPEFVRLSENEELIRNIVFAAVDLPTNRQLATRFDLKGFPILIMFHKHRLYRYKGPRTLDHLLQFLQDVMAGNAGDGEEIPAPISGMQLLTMEFTQVLNQLVTLWVEQPDFIQIGLPIAIAVIVGVLIGIVSLSYKKDSSSKEKAE